MPSPKNLPPEIILWVEKSRQNDEFNRLRGFLLNGPNGIWNFDKSWFIYKNNEIEKVTGVLTNAAHVTNKPFDQGYAFFFSS